MRESEQRFGGTAIYTSGRHWGSGNRWGQKQDQNERTRFDGKDFRRRPDSTSHSLRLSELRPSAIGQSGLRCLGEGGEWEPDIKIEVKKARLQMPMDNILFSAARRARM